MLLCGFTPRALVLKEFSTASVDLEIQAGAWWTSDGPPWSRGYAALSYGAASDFSTILNFGEE
jgi:hypothetical protein